MLVLVLGGLLISYCAGAAMTGLVQVLVDLPGIALGRDPDWTL